MKKHRLRYSLKTEMLIVVILGMVILGVSISTVVIRMSQNIFVDTYGRSQQQVFERIENEMNRVHEDIAKMLDATTDDWYIRLFFRDIASDDLEEFSLNYKMRQRYKIAIPATESMYTALIVSSEGKRQNRTDFMCELSPEEILELPCSSRALLNKGKIVYTYMERGFTSNTKEHGIVVAAKAFNYEYNDGKYAIAYILIPEEVIHQYYEYFTSQMADFYMVDDKGVIVSSSQTERNGKYFTDAVLQVAEIVFEDGEKRIQRGEQTILHAELSYYDFEIYGLIDNEKSLSELYDMRQITAICVAVCVIVSVLILCLVRRMTSPLTQLVRQMEAVRKGDLTGTVEVRGPEEIQKLSGTFNYMTEGLNRYVNELMETQKQKRKAELLALQMQIKPHYIYNTLAGVKYLIWQHEQEKAVDMLEAFIRLLQNTVHNRDEFVTVQSEMEGLKDYAYINGIRYGGKVKVDFFLAQDCREHRVPKLILQPFLENAFLHAFPGSMEGEVEVIASEKDGKLMIVMADNGIGMEADVQKNIFEERGTEQSVGIGIANVHARLRMIYGEAYEMKVVSEPGKGTKISLFLPPVPHKDFRIETPASGQEC